jgi:hypothetical protein
MLLLYISFYIFKAIIFSKHRNIRFWNFQKSKSGGITSVYVPITLSLDVQAIYFIPVGRGAEDTWAWNPEKHHINL